MLQPRPLLRRTSLLAAGGLLLGGPLAAADHGADVDAAEDVTPLVSATLPDTAATRERFATSPYPSLVASDWAQHLLGEARAGLEAETPGLLDALASISRASGALAMPDVMVGSDGPRLAAALTSDQAFQLAQLFMDDGGDFVIAAEADNLWRTEDGRAIRIVDDRVLISAFGGEALLPSLEGATGSGDLHLTLDYGSLLDAMGQLDGEDAVPFQAELAKSFAGAEFDMGITLDDNGLRERAVASGFEAYSWKALGIDVAADRSLLETLPADTLWAFVGVSSREATEAFLEQPIGQALFTDDDVMTTINGMLAQIGLPPYRDLILALDGDILLYARSAAPFPAFTLQVGMSEAVGEQILNALEAELGLVDDGSGVFTGRLQIVPVAASYADGALVVTTHPLGIASHRDRKPGFTDHPAIQAALAEMPDGPLYALGASRSAEWWGTLAALASIPLGQLEIPGIFSLGNDLRATGSHGWMWVREPEVGTVEYEGGGLFGGAVTQYVGVIGGAMGFFWFRMQMMEARFAAAAVQPGQVVVEPAAPPADEMGDEVEPLEAEVVQVVEIELDVEGGAEAEGEGADEHDPEDPVVVP